MERAQMLIDDINNDLEARKRGQETNPFEKQGKIAEMYPSVAINHPEDFYLNEAYYPENTRDKLDSSNKKTVIISIAEIRKAHAFRKDNSMQEESSIKKVA